MAIQKQLRRLLCCCIVTVTIQQASAQKQFNGRVINEQNHGLQGATISLIDTRDSLMVLFTSSDKTGFFQFTVPDSLIIHCSVKVAHNGYDSRQQPLSACGLINLCMITLKMLPDKLPPVIVKTRSTGVHFSADTLSYQVSAFKDNSDRSIRDVIRKLPGIEIDNSGRISYQGKSISHFYIDGDDLFEKRYATAANGIPYDLVESVQILENHQDIKALRNKVRSEQPALNLKLKEEARLRIIGDAYAGAGVTGNHEIGINTMMFKPKLKFFNSIKSNNSGIDYADEMLELGSGFGTERAIAPGINEELILATSTMPALPLSKKRYLLNHSTGFSLNSLVKIDDDSHLKLNAYHIQQKVKQEYNYQASWMLPDSTVTYSENLSGHSYYKPVLLSISYVANKAQYFLSNTLSGSFTPENKNTVVSNLVSTPVDQHLNARGWKIKNELAFLALIRKKYTMEAGVDFAALKAPQSLKISPGPYENVLNKGNPFQQLSQLINPWHVTLSPYVKTKLAFGRLSVGLKTSYQYQVAGIGSYMEFLQFDGSIIKSTDSLSNSFNWRKNTTTLEPKIDWITKNVSANLSLPIAVHRIHYFNASGRTVNANASFVANSPNIRIHVRPGGFHEYGIQANANASIGSIYDAYDGEMFQNYRTLFYNDSLLPEYRVSSIGVNYGFRHPVKLLFVTASLLYLTNSGNSNMENIISNNLSRYRRILRPYENERMNIFFNASKYLFAIKTTFSLKFAFQSENTQGLVNGYNYLTRNKLYTYGIGLRSQPRKWIGLDYNGELLLNKSRSISLDVAAEEIGNRIIQIRQVGSATIQPLPVIVAKIMYERYDNKRSTQNQSASFIDASILLKFPRRNFDVELLVQNIGNQQFYDTFYASQYGTNITKSIIRPRLAMAKFYFRF